MLLKEFAERDALAGLILSDAASLGVIPINPGWDDYGYGRDEMTVCQRDFFALFADDPGSTSLDTVVQYFDCITFLLDRADTWLPIWMCASLYAQDVLERPEENVGGWTEFTLIREMNENRLPVRWETLELYCSRAIDLEYEPELVSSMTGYRIRNKVSSQ